MKNVYEYIRAASAKGQAAIPAEVRRLSKIEPGGHVTFRLSSGQVELKPATMTLVATFGAVKPRKRPEDFKKLRETARVDHARKVVTEMRGWRCSS